jgi:uncharacterized RDD family membrane protein YckC
MEPVRTAVPAVQTSIPSSPKPGFEVRWDADLPVREPGAATARASRGKDVFATAGENSRQPAALSTEGVEVVEAAQPIHANLIQFPRELVVTRKIRPRRAEGPYAASMEAQGQLSIFEVEPWTISTEPAASGAAAEAGTAAWAGPKWSGIELDEEPPEEMASPAAGLAEAQWSEPVAAAAGFEPAPISRRMMAAVVDFSLVTGAFLVAALVASANLRVLPPIKEIELGSVTAEALIGVFYLAFFFILARATPGMNYARLEMCTFAGERPSIAQRCGRSAAIVLSILPLGLGAVMAIFDEQQLSWHDRLSGTYLRRK